MPVFTKRDGGGGQGVVIGGEAGTLGLSPPPNTTLGEEELLPSKIKLVQYLRTVPEVQFVPERPGPRTSHARANHFTLYFTSKHNEGLLSSFWRQGQHFQRHESR